MKVTLRGTAFLNGKFHEFHITIYAPEEAIGDLASVLTKKLLEKGWIPNVQ